VFESVSDLTHCVRGHVKDASISVVGIGILTGSANLIEERFVLLLNFQLSSFNSSFLTLQFTVPLGQLLILFVNNAKSLNKLIK
jgi:hypothetical protein